MNLCTREMRRIKDDNKTPKLFILASLHDLFVYVRLMATAAHLQCDESKQLSLSI